MNIAILSRKRGLHSNARFREAAARLGHEVTILNPLRCQILVGREEVGVYYRDRPVTGIDVVLPRIGPSLTGYGLAVLRQFERMDVPTVNSARSIARARDKFRCLQMLADCGLRIPVTFMARHPSHVKEAIQHVGGVPVVLKLLSGTQGIGVILADTVQAARSTVDTLWSLGQDIMIQEYIREADRSDIRVLVVGGHVLTAMRRTAAPGEFRANIHRGGEGHPVRLTREHMHVAEQAARVLGLNVAGVDLLEGRDGPVVAEVNASPGFKGLEAVTAVDVATTIVEYIVQYCRQAGEHRAAVASS